jgi:hypothetical protein
MKAAALLLVLAFGSLQGISFTDCPCDSLCETKNACPDEKKHETPDDCCSRTREQQRGGATENCFHLEPQTDLDRTSHDLDLDSVLILSVIDLTAPVAPASDISSLVPWGGPSPPSTDPPLFLLHSSLLL